jgi:peptidoglycan hydrolase CwlO-like protein
MTEIFDFLAQNPAYAVAAGVLVMIGAFSLMKKLIKTAIVVGILFFGYCFYLHSEGKALPTTADAEKVLQQGKDMTAKLQKEAREMQEQAQQTSKDVSRAKSKVDVAAAKLGVK